jgi:DNA polymerase-3 subunit gamma/tau
VPELPGPRTERSRYKVYIIDEAHMVTTQGFNALLKLVEEPPEHVRFIFATTEADKVLSTIRSRTHNYTFRLVPSRTLQEHLALVCDREGVKYEPSALALVARAGAGSVRDSLSVLGQVISGSGPEGVTYAEAVLQLGMTDSALLDDVVAALADHDGAALFTVVDRVIEAGHDPRRFVTDLLERFRDLIVLQSIPDAGARGLVEGPDDQLAVESEQAQRFSLAELTRAAEVTSGALTELKGATAPRLHLELMAARLLLPAADTDEVSMRARLDQLERRVAAAPAHAAATSARGTAEVPAPAAQPTADAEEPAPARSKPRRLSDVAPSSGQAAEGAPQAAARAKPPKRPTAGEAPAQAEPPAATSSKQAETGAASSLTVEQIASMWPAVLDALTNYSRVAWMAFSSSRPISLSDGDLAVALPDVGTVKNVKASGHDERLRQAILDVLRFDVRIDVVVAPDRTGPVSAPATSAGTKPAGRAADSAAAAAEDTPSLDDADVDDTTGVDLVMREFGATQIGEIET